jgi:hypothetical protein
MAMGCGVTPASRSFYSVHLLVTSAFRSTIDGAGIGQMLKQICFYRLKSRQASLVFVYLCQGLGDAAKPHLGISLEDVCGSL